MKHYLTLVSLLLLSGFLSVPSGCAPLQTRNTTLGVFPSSINVKDFGAVGDGVADDTAAIQKAVNAATDQAMKWRVRVRHWGHFASGIWDNPHAEIVFPAGTYKISNTIVLGRYSYLRGIGNATIKQSDSAKDSFYFQGLLRAAVENLHFDGGKTQLHFWTNNHGTARISVQHCAFSNSSDDAIESRSWTKVLLEGENWNKSKPWAPYTVEWKEGMPRLTANNADNLKTWYNSTLAVISHCRFENVMHAINLSGDMTQISDCEISTNPQMEGAVFALDGSVNLYRIKGMANLDTGKQQHWIDSKGGRIAVRDCDFNTNQARGICLLRVSARPVLSSVILENTRVKSAGSQENAILWIAKATEPNIVSINNLIETSGKNVKAVTWEETPDAATLDAIKDQPKSADSNRIYKIQIGANSANIDINVPEIFRPLLLKPVPAKALEETDVPELSWTYNDLEKRATKVLFAADYGVDQDPKTDDTAAVQKAFDAARANPHSLLIFPAGIIKLSKTIQLPSNVVARGAGVTAFLLEDTAKDMFDAEDAQVLAFKNIDFDGGNTGLNLRSNPESKAQIAFENCSFYDQENQSILAMAGESDNAKNDMELQTSGGIFATVHALKTNAAHSQMSAFWAINDPRLDKSAYIENRGGRMRVQTMLGNPTLWQGKRGKTPANIDNWQLSSDTRWIDNWGNLYSIDNRFGGESGGMCNVMNHAADGTVYIGGGLTRFYNGATRMAVLYQEQKAKIAVLQNINSVPIRNEQSWVVMNIDGSDGRNDSNVIVRSVPAS